MEAEQHSATEEIWASHHPRYDCKNSYLQDSLSTFNIVPYDLFSGVCALSKLEVKKDIREMGQTASSDTDSDSSVHSEDVLVSSYPVKPRKTPKGPIITPQLINAGRSEVIIEKEYDGKTIDQTLAFLDAIKRSKEVLYNAECDREYLENQSMVRFRDLSTILISDYPILIGC